MKKGPPAHTGYKRKSSGGVVIQSLSEVKAGVVCTIEWMFDSPQVTEFMHQHDIKEGSAINMFQHGRDSMIIGMNNMHPTIEDEATGRIRA